MGNKGSKKLRSERDHPFKVEVVGDGGVGEFLELKISRQNMT